MNQWGGPEQHISKEQRNFMYHAFTGDVEGLKKDFAEQFASAYINVPQEDKTALYWAAINLFPEAVKILLQHGADPFIRPPRGLSAGLTTRRALQEEVWVKKILPRIKDTTTEESLRAANDPQIVAYDAVAQSLVEAEYRRMEPYINKSRISPEKYHVENARLSRYGEHRVADNVHYWLEKKTGQVMPAMAEDNMSPLHVAVARCNDPLVRTLVTKKADINLRNKLGLKPLEMAEIIAHFEKEAKPIATFLLTVETFQNPGRVKVHEVREHGSSTEERIRRKVMKEDRQTTPGKPFKPVGF